MLARPSRPTSASEALALSLDQFLAKRGASTIVARGRPLKASQAALFASIQRRYGVPPGPLIAIWGMETGFRNQRGNQNMLSSIASLALRLPPGRAVGVDARLDARRGRPDAIHAEEHSGLRLRQPHVAANALNSTASFLHAHGWRAGAGYQPGEPNFAAIEAWNAAGVYQKAIAIMGRQATVSVGPGI